MTQQGFEDYLFTVFDRKNGPTLCFVQLTYADKAGQAAQRQQIMEDL